MDIKVFMFSFILTSVLFSLLYIPTKNRNPVTILKPTTTFIIPHNPYNTTFAYLISGSSGHTMKLKRLMLALYHPANHYLIHLNAAAPDDDHREIARFVSPNAVFAEVGNVWIVKKTNLVTYRGPTMLATTLRRGEQIEIGGDGGNWKGALPPKWRRMKQRRGLGELSYMSPATIGVETRTPGLIYS